MPNTQQSKDIDAPIDAVWAKLANFHDMSWAPTIITRVDKVGNVDGGSVGAKRILNGVFHETLVEIDHSEHRLRYSIDDGPSPVSKKDVSNYYGVIELTPLDGGQRTHVEWTSSWDANKDDAVQFCHAIYVGLLEALAGSFRDF